MYEARVRTGGAVYEEGHTLVLGWCENQRDEETMWKLLSQVTHLGHPLQLVISGF